MCAGVRIPQVSYGVLAQSEACVLSKHEVLGSKPRYSKCIRYGVVGNISACHADARGSIPRFGVFFCAKGCDAPEGGLRDACILSYGHTTVKAPHPIRTAKLSTVGPDQYYGRGLRGNLRCCKAFFCFLQNNFFFQKIKFKKSGEGDLNSRPKDGCACALYSPLLYR